MHPSDSGGSHELYLMCDDIEAFRCEMAENKVQCSPVHDEPWGRLTAVSLPGGGTLGIYQPLDPRPPSVGSQGKCAPTFCGDFLADSPVAPSQFRPNAALDLSPRIQL